MPIDPNWQDQHFGPIARAAKLVSTPAPTTRSPAPFALVIVCLTLGAAIGGAYAVGFFDRVPTPTPMADTPIAASPAAPAPPVLSASETVVTQHIIEPTPEAAATVATEPIAAPAQPKAAPVELTAQQRQRIEAIRRGMDLQARELAAVEAKGEKAAADLTDALAAQQAALWVAKHPDSGGGGGLFAPPNDPGMGYIKQFSAELHKIQPRDRALWLSTLVNNTDAGVRSCRQRLNDADKAKATKARQLQKTADELAAAGGTL